jgi:hypothetical protein
MDKEIAPPVLVTPYTLMEEEATYWSLLLFGPLLFLHPYALAWPDPYQGLLAEGLIHVLSPDRTSEEIRQKDRRLREFQTFVAQRPDFSFLEYLKQAKPGKELETRDEILDLLRGKPVRSRDEAEPRNVLEGDVFLCIIHDRLNKEWEIDLSLEQLQEQELGLARLMDQSPEFSNDWSASERLFVAPFEAEIICPPALAAWKELRVQLAPGPRRLLTNQPWVRRVHYGATPEDFPGPGLPLPALRFPSIEEFLENYRRWSQTGDLGRLRYQIEGFLSEPGTSDQNRAEFLEALNQLHLKAPGRYSLYLPPPALPFPEPEPLLLITSAGLL